MKIKKLLGKIGSTIIWTILTIITLFPIYWMVLVSTRTPVELFGKPNLYPTFFEKIHWKKELNQLLLILKLLVIEAAMHFYYWKT